MSDFSDKFKKVGALWRNRSGKGLSGSLSETLPEGTRVIVFESTSKLKPTSPDFQIFIERAPDQNSN